MANYPYYMSESSTNPKMAAIRDLWDNNETNYTENKKRLEHLSRAVYDEIKIDLQAIRDAAQWVYYVDTQKVPGYFLIGKKTETDVPGDSNWKKDRWMKPFKIINKVLVYSDNSPMNTHWMSRIPQDVLPNEEIEQIENGIVPERFKNIG